MLLGWYWLIATSVNRLTAEELVPSSNWLLAAIPLLALYLLARNEGWWILWIPISFMLSPFVVAFSIWNAIRKSSPLISGLLRLGLSPVTNLLCVATVGPLLFLTWFVLLTTRQPDTLYGFILFEVFLTSLILFISFRWATDPLYALTSLVDVVNWLYEKVGQGPASWRAKTGDERTKDIANTLQLMMMCLTAVNHFHWVLERLVKRTIVPLFLFVLITLFSVTVLGYGVAIYAAQRLETPAFDGLSEPSLFRSCVFSVSVITTAPLPNVVPATDLGRLLYMMELLSTFFIVSVFFALFSAAWGIHSEGRVKELETAHKKYADIVASHLKDLLAAKKATDDQSKP